MFNFFLKIFFFLNKNFADFVVTYFKNNKKLGFLLKSDLIKRTDISKCLNAHKTISWIKDIKIENFSVVSELIVLNFVLK